MCVFERMLFQPGYQLQASALCLMNKTETRDGKPTRQQISDQSKCSVPLLYIIKHGSNWKQTSERTPSKFSTCSAPPSVHFPFFRFAYHPFSSCNLKTNGNFRSKGRKTNNRREGEKERSVTEQTVGTKSALKAIRFYKEQDDCRLICHLVIVFNLHHINVSLVSMSRLGTEVEQR